ncbi:MAG: hypothetical protein QME12_01815 [Nanoarchaeota archaeon]|nr:hypothetical protein [Nanoarchaeota archaeon]
MENKAIRRRILEYLYQKDEDNPSYPISRDELKLYMNIPDNKLDSNVLYLEEKGYLKLSRGLGSLFFSAEITAFGKDLIENPEDFNAIFPLTLNIITNSSNIAIGDNNVQTSTLFEGIYNQIEKQNPNNKQQIKEAIISIEQELKKAEPSRNLIGKALDFLRDNAAWILPTVIEVIKKYGF